MTWSLDVCLKLMVHCFEVSNTNDFLSAVDANLLVFRSLRPVLVNTPANVGASFALLLVVKTVSGTVGNVGATWWVNRTAIDVQFFVNWILLEIALAEFAVSRWLGDLSTVGQSTVAKFVFGEALQRSIVTVWQALDVQFQWGLVGCFLFLLSFACTFGLCIGKKGHNTQQE